MSLYAKRRHYFSKTQLLGSEFIVCRKRAGCKSKTANARAHASLTAERFVVLVDFQTFYAICSDIFSARKKNNKHLSGNHICNKRNETVRKTYMLSIRSTLLTVTKTGFQLTVCRQTSITWNSWNRGSLRLFQCTCVAKNKQSAVALLFSVREKKKQRDCSDGMNRATRCRK